jgi:tetratricopeptide (TPR) repeat protein
MKKIATQEHQYKDLNILLFILVVTVIAYFKSLYFDFNLRDDDVYVVNNPLIKDFTLNGFINVLTKHYYQGHLPATMLSYYIDYFFWALNPLGYHLTNFAIHFFNIILVFILSKKIVPKQFVYVFISLIFALHPLNIESVAWVSERKNVLYAFFFLLATISYINYLKGSKKSLYFSLLFFILSVLSKWAAYPFAVITILFDWYYKRNFLSKAYFIEKVIFILIPIISVLIHLKSGSVLEDYYTMTDRFFLATHSFCFYISKIVIPYNLSTLYPYPDKHNGFLPALYYLSIIPVIALSGILIYLYKKHLNTFNIWLFGLMFFSMNIGMVLQIVYIGGHVVVADRYTYIPMFGILFIVAIHLNDLIQKNIYKTIIFVLTALILTTYVHNRTQVWENTISIYTDAINKNPKNNLAWLNRGMLKSDMNDYNGAKSDLDSCIIYFPQNEKCYYNRGVLLFNNNKFTMSLKDFKKTIQLNSKNNLAYEYIGLIELENRNFDLAKENFKKAILIDSSLPRHFHKLAYTFEQLNEQDSAIYFYNKALIIDSTYLLSLINRGWVYYTTNNYTAALNDYNKIILYDSSNALVYNNRGLIYMNEKNYKLAIDDFKKSISINSNLYYPYFNIAKIYLETNNKEYCYYFNYSYKLGNNSALYYINNYCK